MALAALATASHLQRTCLSLAEWRTANQGCAARLQHPATPSAQRDAVAGSLWGDPIARSADRETAEAHFAQWLREWRTGRHAHEAAQAAAHSASSLDDQLLHALKHERDGRQACAAMTALLNAGARADCPLFEGHELGNGNLGDLSGVIDECQERVHGVTQQRSRFVQPMVQLLRAFSTSGSPALRTNRRNAGNGGSPLPEYLMRGAVCGWAHLPHFCCAYELSR